MRHYEGETIIYVLNGTIILQLAECIEAFEACDCANFNSAALHQIASRGNELAEVLMVIAATP